MNQPSKTYISLGSNKGDKFKNLQLAIDAIYYNIGHISAISKVYESPAFGFESDDFLNVCICVETHSKPSQLMKQLLKIETSLGRTRSKSKGYEARTIDLDIVLVDDLIIKTKTVQIPHPEMHKRRFVLQPLYDIAKGILHPKQNKTIADLLELCKDESTVTPISIWLKNPYKSYKLSHYKYIAIEGNIGAGKTSLATKIAQDFNAKLILERFVDNPFLPKFYEDPKNHAFTLEMSFLADRYQQITDDLAHLDLFKDFIIGDYDVFKSLIFSKVTLREDEFKLYRKLFYLMYKDISKPDLYIYLYQNIERLQENIKKRGRDYEQNIDNDYLEKINSGYLEFLKNQTDFNVKIIDISEKDFIKSRTDYLSIIEEINLDL